MSLILKSTDFGPCFTTLTQIEQNYNVVQNHTYIANELTEFDVYNKVDIGKLERAQMQDKSIIWHTH